MSDRLEESSPSLDANDIRQPNHGKRRHHQVDAGAAHCSPDKVELRVTKKERNQPNRQTNDDESTEMYSHSLAAVEVDGDLYAR